MKTLYFTFFLLLAGISGVFGGDFSISTGLGGILGGTFTKYNLSAGGIVEGAQIQIDAAQKMNQFNYGFFAFFDATYGIFSISFQNGMNKFEESYKLTSWGSKSNSETSSGDGWESVIGFSLLGKYPFNFTERLTIFPLLGIEYQVALSQKRSQADGYVYNRTDGYRESDKDGKAFRLRDWNSFFVNLGGGLDFFLKDKLFLRGELLYGFRLMTSYETKNLDRMRKEANDPRPKLSGLTSGPSMRLSVGYKFF